MAEVHRVWFERAVLPRLEEEVAAMCAPLGPGRPGDEFAGIDRAEAIIAGSYEYTGAVMDLAPDLRVISRTGIGYDRVDIDAATKRHVVVCNAPDAPTISTAEHTIMLVLAVVKRLKESERRLRAGETDLYAGHDAVELDEKVLGLVGFGRIARRVAGVAAAMGMRVHTYDPYRKKSGEVVNHETLAGLLAHADVVSVHVPLNDETTGMFGAEQFATMKPGSVFVNTARGGLVDHEALLDSLEQEHLMGAGLDVTDPEPLPPDHGLLHRENVVVTPHVATATDAAKERLLMDALEQALQVLDGRRPPNVVNPEVLA